MTSGIKSGGKKPRYLQLREIIRQKIQSGEYAPGTALPSEQQLADTFGMHRLSVRIALDELIRSGALKSIQGKGIFVCGPKNENRLEGFHINVAEPVKDQESRLLIDAVREAGPYYAKLLHIEPVDSIWYIRRVVSNNGEPYAIKNTVIPCALAPGLGEIDMKHFSLYDALSWSNIHLSAGEQILRMTFLDPAMARLLNITPDTAVMEISYTLLNEQGVPAAYSCCYIRGDQTEFYVRYQNKTPVAVP